MLELHGLLKEQGLSNWKFYQVLRDAYSNSGRVDDGVCMLRMIYHSTRDFDDVDIFFTLLATLVCVCNVNNLNLMKYCQV